jgi:Flp pilus assembly protein TadG
MRRSARAPSGGGGERSDAATAGAHGHVGSATVEFALVLPLLLILLLATLEVALLVKDQLVMQGAARAGAREAAVTTDDAAVRRAVIDAAPGIDEGLVEVAVARGSPASDEVTVRVSYRDPVVVPALGWLFPPSVGIGGTAVMRQETG